MAHDIKDQDFESEVLQSDQPVLVDFWAEWCGPCRQLSPLVEGLAQEFKNLKVVKVNIDENPETPIKYNVRGIPTLIIFKSGQPISTKVGSMPKTSLHEWVKSIAAA